MSKSESREIRILYLDDEQENLSSFKASFRRDYSVYTATTADEALKVAKTEEPQVVISDQRMPGMTGVEFFERLVSINPFQKRVLLTAYTSSQAIIEAINRGQIDLFILKPWDRDSLKEKIQQLHKEYSEQKLLYSKNEELFKLNSELNRFVYNVSHDLRSPLMAILGLLNLCREEHSTKQRMEYFELMEQSIKKADDFIQTTLQYYRNLKTDLILETIDVKTVVQDLIDPIEAYNDRLTFKVEISENLEIKTDRVRFRIALSNIINNAVKYGFKDENRSYTITITAGHIEDYFKLIVSDEGKGIPHEKLKTIFEIFSSENSESSIETSGIGLYLVQQAMERIGGEVNVRSKMQKGTEFEIKIPHSSMVDPE